MDHPGCDSYGEQVAVALRSTAGFFLPQLHRLAVALFLKSSKRARQFLPLIILVKSRPCPANDAHAVVVVVVMV